MPTLQVDDREDEKYINSIRKTFEGSDVEVMVGRWDVGDYFVGNVLGIEHKAPDDFISSITDQRIFQQAYELKEAFAKPVILVDGDINQLLFNRFGQPGSVMAAICSLYVHYDVPVFFCGASNFGWTVQTLIKKAVDGKVPIYTPIRKSAPIKDQQLALICSLGGLGPKKGASVLAEYRTPLNAFNNWERWGEDVSGIGPTIKERVGKVLTEESS